MLIFFLIFLIQLEVGTSISYSQKPLSKKKSTHFQIEKKINQGLKWFILEVKQKSGIGDNW